MADERKLITELGRHYKKVYIPLDTARENEEFEIYGDFILVEEINAGTTCEIRLNSKQNDPINLIKVRRIESPFSRFYLTNDAFTGGYVKLLIGGEAQFSAMPVLPTEVEKANIYAYDGTTWKGVRIDPTTSGVLTQVVGASVNLPVSIESSTIQVPVDLQSILPKKAELYGADETVAQSVTLDVGGFKTVEVFAEATAATIFKVEFSFDNVHWFTYYESAAAETSYSDVFTTCAQYIRISSQAAGAAGDTVTLIIAAKP